ncbi:MAG TPA: hypothetical protein VFJ90_04000, partial [Candidatus Didemnitutus sp.]|nr:hypothetical protein [Candidatus Didemnitutus sp.]
MAFALGVVALGGGIGFQLSRRAAPRSELLGERILGLAGHAAVDDEDMRMVAAVSAKDGTPPKILEALANELQTQKVSLRDLIEAIPVLAPY